MPIVAQIVGEPVDQRRLGPDHDQADRVAAAEIDHGAMVGGVERDQLGMLGDAGIAGRRVELAQQRRLRELPGERMFAPARTDEQDIHERRPLQPTPGS